MSFLIRIKSGFAYIIDRKALLISLTYILSHILFLYLSWLGLVLVLIVGLFLISKGFKVFILILIVVLICGARNYADLHTEQEVRDHVDEKYLDEYVELEGYVYSEPDYKHKYARVVFNVDDGYENFLVQGNVSRFPRLEVGQVCTIRGTLNEPESFNDFDYKAYLRDRRIYYLISYPELNCLDEKDGFWVMNYLMGFKNDVRSVVENRLHEPQASIFLGVLFGERRVFEDSFQEALQVASITHIIVASGYNVSIIYLGINRVFFFLPKRSRTLCTIFLIWVYCALVGFTPSIIRATLMLSLTLLAVYYGMVSNIHIIFFFSILIFIFIDPRIVSSFGFLLSVSATGGLIYITPIIDELLSRLLDAFVPLENLKNSIYKFLQNYCVPSMACTVVTIPIIAYGFQKISIVGVVTNMMILPVLEYTLMLGLVTIFLNYLFPLIVDFLFMTIWVQLKYFELVVSYLGSLDIVSYEIDMSISIVICIYILLCIFIIKFAPLDGRNYYLNIYENN